MEQEGKVFGSPEAQGGRLARAVVPSLCLSEALKDEVRKALQKEDYSTSERISFKKKGKGSLKQLL